MKETSHTSYFRSYKTQLLIWKHNFVAKIEYFTFLNSQKNKKYILHFRILLNIWYNLLNDFFSPTREKYYLSRWYILIIVKIKVNFISFYIKKYQINLFLQFSLYVSSFHTSNVFEFWRYLDESLTHFIEKMVNNPLFTI